jgi:hypothetical protein
MACILRLGVGSRELLERAALAQSPEAVTSAIAAEKSPD